MCYCARSVVILYVESHQSCSVANRLYHLGLTFLSIQLSRRLLDQNRLLMMFPKHSEFPIQSLHQLPLQEKVQGFIKPAGTHNINR